MYRTLVTIIGILLSLSLGITAISDLPSNFPRCHRLDPKMEECLLNATEYVRPYVSEGIHDFLPAIKEFIVPQVTIDQRGNRAYNFLMHIANLSILGMDRYKFKRYVFAPREPYSVFLDVDLPELSINGKYDITANLFFASIKGQGNLFANITNSNCKCRYTLQEIKKNGVGYLHSNRIVAKMHIGNITDYGFNGIFNDTKDLEMITHEILNKNLHVLVEEITPSIEKVIEVFLNEVIALALEKIPFDKLYPK